VSFSQTKSMNACMCLTGWAIECSNSACAHVYLWFG